MFGYIYGADGIRVAKGTISPFTCDFNPSDTNYNHFIVKTSWVLGAGGEQVTEYSVSGGTSTWVHSNAFGDGKLLATYRDTNTYFALEDWLGSKRAEISADNSCGTAFRSLPYGNGLTLVTLAGYTSSCIDATEHHFTGKERDAESGNDYFGARYYSSAMGRFMSPDWSAKDEPVPYAKLDDPQTLNLYSYVENNPLTRADVDGHATCANAPSCTMSTIDAHPAGEKGPTITFKNDNPNGKSPNQPVTTKTAVMIEKAVIKSGVKSVNINSTTGGKHAAASNHAKARAVDIDTVNGRVAHP
jgi:RHS repeat-associated protein